MNEASTILRHACCLDNEAGGTFDEVANAAPILACGPVIGPAPAQPQCPAAARAIAWHEVAHALSAIALGGVVGRVAITAPNPLAVVATPDPHGAATDLAGPVGTDLAHSIIRRESDAAIRPYLARVRAGLAGRCDHCRAARAALAEAGPDADDAAVLAAWRRAEALALAIVTSEPGRRFIRIAARELQSKGELPGSYFHNLAKEILPDDFAQTLGLEG